MARQLSDVELTERLREAKPSSWTANFGGKRARQALAALADASAFLQPPPAEILADATPDAGAQRSMISLAVDYLNKTITKLPNFYATRTTVRYEETPRYVDASTPVDYLPLHAAASSKATVLYSNGKEVVDSRGAKRKKRKAADGYLLTYGVFGPLLGAVTDAIASGLTWNRWEKSADASSCGICLSDSGGEIALSSGRLLSSRRRRNQSFRRNRRVSRGDRDRSAERSHPSLGTGGRPEIIYAACPVRHHDRIWPGGDRREDLYLPSEERLHFEREICDASNGMG